MAARPTPDSRHVYVHGQGGACMRCGARRENPNHLEAGDPAIAEVTKRNIEAATGKPGLTLDDLRDRRA